jgi:NifU-like protein involved in Fe-S cluster formation
VDDDLIARMVGQATMSAAQADMQRSLVLGETYEEASEVVERMVELAREVRAQPNPP